MVKNPKLVRYHSRLGPITFPPACERTAKQKRVEGLVLPSTWKSPKAAACPSMGWDTFLSTEYSCMAPTTRFCCGTQGVENRSANAISVSVPLRSTGKKTNSSLFSYAGIFSYLRRDADQQQPLLLLIRSVVDDLTACQTGVSVENFGGLRISLHAPVVDGRIGHQGNSVHRYPLPEHHVLRHSVSL